MIVSHRYKFIFFSFPKTGSETLRSILGPFNDESVMPWRQRNPFYSHISPIEMQSIFKNRNWDFDSYRRITCVRNPFPRLVSLYRMICRVDGFWRNGFRPEFDSWLKTITPDGRGGGGRPHQRWRRYGAWSARTWLHDSNGRSLVNDVIRLEDIETKIPKILFELGLPNTQIPHLNHQLRVDWEKWYSPHAKRWVERKYAWDLMNLNYST